MLCVCVRMCVAGASRREGGFSDNAPPCKLEAEGLVKDGGSGRAGGKPPLL